MYLFCWLNVATPPPPHTRAPTGHSINLAFTGKWWESNGKHICQKVEEEGAKRRRRSSRSRALCSAANYFPNWIAKNPYSVSYPEPGEPNRSGAPPEWPRSSITSSASSSKMATWIWAIVIALQLDPSRCATSSIIRN